jgi:hypothetical protein
MQKRQINPAIGLTERHHIIPKSMGGSNERLNIAVLTIREHLIAHAFLTRITSGIDNIRMSKALSRMLNGRQITVYKPKSSILFEQLRIRARCPMSSETKAKLSLTRQRILRDGEIQKKISDALKGRTFPKPPMSEEQKRMVSAAHKGKVISEEQKKKLSIALKGKKQNQPKWSEARKIEKSKQMFGLSRAEHSEETKKKIGAAHKGKVISEEQKKKLSIAQSAAMKKRWAEKKALALVK